MDSRQQNRCRAGVDVGGTFTDIIVVNDETGRFSIEKTLTTPSNPSEAIEAVLREDLRKAGISIENLRTLVHGTTLVTNALIERKGAVSYTHLDVYKRQLWKRDTATLSTLRATKICRAFTTIPNFNASSNQVRGNPSFAEA